MNKIRPLIVVGQDRNLRATLADLISTSVIRAIDAGHAASFAERVNGLLALAPDAVDNTYEPLKCEFVILHAGGFSNWQKALELGAKHVWELPAELDWLVDELGSHTTTLKRNTP